MLPAAAAITLPAHATDKKKFERCKPRPNTDTPRDHAPVVRQKFDARQGRVVIPVKRAQIIAGSAIQFHPLTSLAGNAVVLDFVQPECAARRLRGGRGEAWGYKARRQCTRIQRHGAIWIGAARAVVNKPGRRGGSPIDHRTKYEGLLADDGRRDPLLAPLQEWPPARADTGPTLYMYLWDSKVLSQCSELPSVSGRLAQRG